MFFEVIKKINFCIKNEKLHSFATYTTKVPIPCILEM